MEERGGEGGGGGGAERGGGGDGRRLEVTGGRATPQAGSSILPLFYLGNEGWIDWLGQFYMLLHKDVSELLVKLAISPSHSILTPDWSVPALTLQVCCMVAA